MKQKNAKQEVVTYNAVLDATCSQQDISCKLVQEGIAKGFYSKISRLGSDWPELDPNPTLEVT
jgi:hypothetical protein